MQNPKAAKTSIIEELHLTRQRLLKEHGGVAGLANYLRQQEVANSAGKITAQEQGQPPQTRSR
jgi:hypothetical protein